MSLWQSSFISRSHSFFLKERIRSLAYSLRTIFNTGVQFLLSTQVILICKFQDIHETPVTFFFFFFFGCNCTRSLRVSSLSFLPHAAYLERVWPARLAEPDWGHQDNSGLSGGTVHYIIIYCMKSFHHLVNIS